jgi:hypothetical protein
LIPGNIYELTGALPYIVLAVALDTGFLSFCCEVGFEIEIAQVVVFLKLEDLACLYVDPVLRYVGMM